MKLTPTLGGAYSGSIGGLTASHNKGGQYFRRRSVPTNPNTLRQQIVRAVTGGLVQSWTNDLTDAERQAWRAYAENTPTTDSLGQTIQMSGINAFVKSNAIKRQFEQLTDTPGSILAAAPVIFNTGQPIASNVQFAINNTTPPGILTIDWNLAGPAPDNGDAFLFVAPPQTAGTRYYKGPYQLAASVAVAATDELAEFTVTLATPDAWLSDHVPVVAWDGLSIPLRIVMVYDDGRVSEDWRGLVPFTDATP